MDVRAKQLRCYQRVFLPLTCVLSVSPHVISAVISLLVNYVSFNLYSYEYS